MQQLVQMVSLDCKIKGADLEANVIKSYWLSVALRINVALAIFQPYRDLDSGDNQSLKRYQHDRE